MLHRLDDGPLDFIGDLLFAPVLELCAGCELAHKVGAMAPEPLVWVTSGRMQATQFQLGSARRPRRVALRPSGETRHRGGAVPAHACPASRALPLVPPAPWADLQPSKGLSA